MMKKTGTSGKKKTGASSNAETKALLAALKRAATAGWDMEPDDDFPRGGVDRSLAFSAWADAEMLKKLKGKKFESLRVRDKVAAGVTARLEVLAPHRAALKASLAFMAAPPRHILLPKMVWATADKIWRAAGDTATDYNHYTKRILLAGVLTATTLFWLNDESAGYAKTDAFLARRIDNVLKIGGLMGKLKKKRAV